MDHRHHQWRPSATAPLRWNKWIWRSQSKLRKSELLFDSCCRIRGAKRILRLGWHLFQVKWSERPSARSSIRGISPLLENKLGARLKSGWSEWQGTVLFCRKSGISSLAGNLLHSSDRRHQCPQYVVRSCWHGLAVRRKDKGKVPHWKYKPKCLWEMYSTVRTDSPE